MVNVELPPGASVERTDEVMKQVADACLETDGVAHTVQISGYSIFSSANIPNNGGIYVAAEAVRAAEGAARGRHPARPERQVRRHPRRDGDRVRRAADPRAGQRRRVQDADPGQGQPGAGDAGRDDLGAGRRGEQEPGRGHPGRVQLVPVEQPAAVPDGGPRPRPADGRVGAGGERRAAVVHGAGVRQRHHPGQPQLAGDGAGRRAVPPLGRRPEQDQGPRAERRR